MQAILALCSGDAERVRSVLRSREPLSAHLVAYAIPLLTQPALSLDVLVALVKAAPTCSGQLVDALCDGRSDVRMRRLLARTLARCPTRAGTEGLMNSISDEHFEVRYACGRALVKIRAASPATVFRLDRIVGILTLEVRRERSTWTPDRVDRSMEHVFNLLALHSTTMR